MIGKEARDPALPTSLVALRQLKTALVQIAGTGKRFLLRRADFKPQAPRSKLPAQLRLERPDGPVRTVLADAVHQLDAGDRDRRIPECLEAEHHGDPLLHASMVLLNRIIQVFDERSFVSAGSEPSAFSSRTAR